VGLVRLSGYHLLAGEASVTEGAVMATNDADRSRDEGTEEREKAAAGEGASTSDLRPKAPQETPMPESEPAAIPISEPSAPGVWDADSERRAARGEASVERDDVAVGQSAVPPVPDPGLAPEPDAGGPPSRDASVPPPAAGEATIGASASSVERPAGAPAEARSSETMPRAAGAAFPPGATERGRGQAGEPSPLRQHLTSRTTWLRFVYMVLFVVLWGVSRIVLGAVVIMQFLWVLLSGESNPRLAMLGQTLATYSYEVILYLTFNTERQPFPFSDWPSGPPGE
jgi:hypothetical protein